jgi:hypothetical protein
MSIPLNEAFVRLEPLAATYTRLPVLAEFLKASNLRFFLSGLGKESARTQ